MKNSFTHKVLSDLRESKINWKVALLFIPIGFCTFLFHEFGHWSFGEALGNDMTISLNNSSPANGFYLNESDKLWSAIGGPAFTILQALIFLIILKTTNSVYAFPAVFFAGFSRFFSIVFGGINLQDEFRIGSMLNISEYLIATIVLLILFIIIWKSTKILELNLKAVGYYITLSTITVLVVIGASSFI